MSQYSKIVKGNKGQDIKVSWGSDHALGYWYDKWDETAGDEGWEKMIEEESTRLSGLRRTKFIDFLIEINAPENHMKSVELNESF